MFHLKSKWDKKENSKQTTEVKYFISRIFLHYLLLKGSGVMPLRNLIYYLTQETTSINTIENQIGDMLLGTLQYSQNACSQSHQQLYMPITDFV